MEVSNPAIREQIRTLAFRFIGDGGSLWHATARVTHHRTVVSVLARPADSHDYECSIDVTASGREQAKVELKRLRVHDANGLKVPVVPIQQVVRVRLDDSARYF